MFEQHNKLAELLIRKVSKEERAEFGIVVVCSHFHIIMDGMLEFFPGLSH